MNFPGADIQELVGEIAAILRRRSETLAVSEAACGGLISAALVLVPGASNFYIGGKLVYSLKQRLKLSGWSETDIQNYMGPSQQVALKLARTTKYELGATYVLSETGFAGPSKDLHLNNQNSEAEVGTVYLGLTGPNVQVSTEKKTGELERSKNMTSFAKLGLEFLLTQLRLQDKKDEKEEKSINDEKDEKDITDEKDEKDVKGEKGSKNEEEPTKLDNTKE
jgi:PncC family amidohydrolase